MKVLFSNPPWWVKEVNVETQKGAQKAWLAGVRAGSRWPFTLITPSSPDHFVFGGYFAVSVFHGALMGLIHGKKRCTNRE